MWQEFKLCFYQLLMPLALNWICQESRGKYMFNRTALEMDDFLCIKKRTILHIQILQSIYFNHGIYAAHNYLLVLRL